jgi:excisionase family DNA binding protein
VRGTGAASGSPSFSAPITDIALRGSPLASHEVAVATQRGPLLLDALEVARLLRIGRTKTYQLIASGELPVVRIGRCVRVSQSLLYSWVESRASTRVQGASQA